MDEFEVPEGLTQGNPLAPSYAQLVYSNICKGVREEHQALMVLSSFFDDMRIIDEPDLAFLAFDDLKAKLGDEGLGISFVQSKVYSVFPLDDKQQEKFQKRGLQMGYDGVVILGTPVGSGEFIKARLTKEVGPVMDIREKIKSADSLGKLNNKWATPQGLYNLVRQCAHQVLKHLLRTVNPNSR